MYPPQDELYDFKRGMRKDLEQLAVREKQLSTEVTVTLQRASERYAFFAVISVCSFPTEVVVSGTKTPQEGFHFCPHFFASFAPMRRLQHRKRHREVSFSAVLLLVADLFTEGTVTFINASERFLI